VSPSRVWGAWLIANVMPSVVVSVLMAVAATTLGTNTSAVVAYVVLFAMVSMLQARVWSRWLATGKTPPGTGRRWIMWTLIGLVAAMFFGVGTLATLDGLGYERLGLITGWVIAGLVLGLAQAPLLGVAAGRAAWWVAASVVGWATAAAVYAPLSKIAAPIVGAPGVRWLLGGLAIEGNVELAITAVTFAVYGLLTGAVLARLTPRGAALTR
jgi:hypothetical protein